MTLGMAHGGVESVTDLGFSSPLAGAWVIFIYWEKRFLADNSQTFGVWRGSSDFPDITFHLFIFIVIFTLSFSFSSSFWLPREKRARLCVYDDETDLLQTMEEKLSLPTCITLFQRAVVSIIYPAIVYLYT